MLSIPVPASSPASMARTVTVPTRLFHKQRGLLYLLLGFVLSSLLFIVIVWLAGKMPSMVWLGALQFFLLPLTAFFVWKNLFVEPASLSFTTQGLSLEASDEHYQIAWANLATYKVEFSLDKLIGAGYRLTLRDVQGHSTVFNLLERQLLDSAGGFRADSALAYLCRYIGWHNTNAESNANQIEVLPTLFDRKVGVLLLAGLAVLTLVDVGLRVLHPVKAGGTAGTLIIALVLGLQLLGQKRSSERYKSYLLKLQEEGGKHTANDLS